MFGSVREGASPAESVPDERNVKCVRELISRTPDKASILIRKTAVTCYRVELQLSAVQLEWNRGLDRLYR